MARETKVVQSHPDREMQTINFYQKFGWEVIGNQRCQEEEKRGDTWYTITFNKITFSREKNEPWYDRVCELEQRTLYLNDKGIDAIDGTKYGVYAPAYVPEPQIAKRGKFFLGLILLIVGLIGVVVLGNEILPNLTSELIPLFGILAAACFFLTVSNVKNIKGLSGQAAKDALNEYYQYRSDYTAYTNKLEQILDDEYDAIEAELNTLLK